MALNNEPATAVRVVASPVRSGSAVDVIHHGSQAEVDALLAALEACIADDAQLKPPDEPFVTLVDVQGRAVELTRFALAALPGQVADVSAGLLAASSTLAALLLRARTGRGVHVDQPLVSGPLPFLTWAFAELGAFQDMPFSKLSSGMKSRLAFSIASR